MREWRTRNLDDRRLKEREWIAAYRERKRAEDPAWRPSKSKTPRDPAAHRAQEAVRRAVKSGRITKPARCAKCDNEGPVEAAHFNYLERYRIIWLCRPCHRQWDANTPKSYQVDAPPLATPRGEATTSARLTEDDVRLVKRSTDSSTVLARRLGVHKSTIKDIRAGRSWKHVH